ncbi:MAG TPA: hypothetical protein VGI05_19055 [Streptosporangiaceae bacterium]
MCDDHSPGLSRRQVLHSAGALAAAAAVLGRVPRRLAPRSPARPAALGGSLLAYSMAMHIHSSFSEQSGSMDSQFYQAATNAVDVLWLTDHDHRMDGVNYRNTVHFTSLTGEKGGPGQGGNWTWQERKSGPVSGASAGKIVTTPCSPNDPVAGGALSLTVGTSGGNTATLGFYANSQPAAWNYRDNLTGQSLSFDVMLKPGWANGYLELLIDTSYHEASAGRPAGLYSLSYRIVPAHGQHGTRAAQGNQGIITCPVTADGATWTTVTVTPSDDIAVLWPDLDNRDFALWELFLNAASTGDQVSGYFDYLNFHRTLSGGEFFSQQADMISALSAEYAAVTARQGLEVSRYLPHVNCFGGAITVPGYQGITASNYSAFLGGSVIPGIHSTGGLVSYNHPFGYSDIPAYPQATQDQMLTRTAGALLADHVLGCDLLEVGYNLRQGVDLAHHLSLWDIFSRNAVFLTGSGTSDDHFGTDWYGIKNNWITSAWAASTGTADLVAALAAGQAWCGSLSEFGAGASLNLAVDGSCPMGSASLSSLPRRQLAVTATGIPAGGSLVVLQGAVDYAGTTGLADNTQVIAGYSGTQLAAAGGVETLAVDTSSESFAVLRVTDASGTTVAASNPVWMLRKLPPNGIPAPRQA